MNSRPICIKNNSMNQADNSIRNRHACHDSLEIGRSENSKSFIAMRRLTRIMGNAQGFVLVA